MFDWLKVLEVQELLLTEDLVDWADSKSSKVLKSASMFAFKSKY